MLVAGLWSFNGAGQAVAWPALARVFMAWFPDPAIRGFWYSILATNQNLGGSLSPRVYPPLMEDYGWEIALWLPAAFTLVYVSECASAGVHACGRAGVICELHCLRRCVVRGAAYVSVSSIACPQLALTGAFTRPDPTRTDPTRPCPNPCLRPR